MYKYIEEVYYTRPIVPPPCTPLLADWITSNKRNICAYMEVLI